MKALGISVKFCTFYLFKVELINGNGKVIATTPEPPAIINRFSSGNYGNRYIYQLNNINNDTFERYKLTWNPGWQVYNNKDYAGGVIFTVPVADITDTGMRARLLKIYQYTDPDETDGVFKLLKTTEVKK
jgi:hypothetical protein